MKPKKTYNYDPVSKKLVILVDGKIVGGFTGSIAEREFIKQIGLGSDVNITAIPPSRSSMIKQLRAMWINQGIDKHRESILEPYGVTSTADLSDEQLKELIARFTPSTRKQNDAAYEVRQLRSNVLTLLQRLGVYDNSGNWTRVNEYMMDKRIAGKLLYECSYDELVKLEHKLRSILSKQPDPFFTIHLN
jgi:hypothetical protein